LKYANNGLTINLGAPQLNDMAWVLPVCKWGLVVKFMHHVTDMECEHFFESETELLECSGSGGWDRI